MSNLLNHYKNILTGYKTAVVDDVKDKLFGEYNSNEVLVKNKTFYINVVVLPLAAKNPNFQIGVGIQIANLILNYYGQGYADLQYAIRFERYESEVKSLENCIIIGENEKELSNNIQKYTNEIFFKYCKSGPLGYSSNLEELDKDGKVVAGIYAWNPERASTGNINNGGYDNHGMIRLDHLQKIDALNPLTNNEKAYKHNINLAFLLLHIIGHNALKEGHGDSGSDMGIMVSGSSLGSLLEDIKKEPKSYIPELNHFVDIPLLQLMLKKPINMDYINYNYEDLPNITSGAGQKEWERKYGMNGRYLYAIFNHFKNN
jgi:hypothetical protein